ncbi:MAG: metabolite traffic protein EboE, partial [Polyangiales bacterium]
MRFRSRQGRAGFLGYCANVHPGESLESVLQAVQTFGPGVREALAVPALSLGLWLSDASLRALQAGGSETLKRALDAAGVFVVTMNGFPYGNFHADVVKRQVYHPDLGTPQRREYLRGLAEVLCQLLPADAAEGSISTLPIGHRDEPLAHDGLPPSAAADARVHASSVAAAQLCRLCDELARLRDATGKSIRICLEPEPGCWLESTDDALRFFTDTLPAAGRQHGVSRERLEQHLGLCYDTCHQAVCFEDAAESLTRLTRAGVRIGKAQLSSALELTQPSAPEQKAELLRFAEPRFLHQARSRDAAGVLHGVDDLDQLSALPDDHPWRVHFHVPIHRERFGVLGTTRPFLEAALPLLAALDPLPHLEIETYTW